MSQFDQAKCDICGDPATHACRDFIRHESPAVIWVECVPIGHIRYGCEQHPVEPEEFVTQLSKP